MQISIFFLCYIKKKLLFSTPVLNRCVPKNVQEVSDLLLSNVYAFLNSWDTLEQILGDLYNTWREIVGLTVLSLRRFLQKKKTNSTFITVIF